MIRASCVSATRRELAVGDDELGWEDREEKFTDDVMASDCWSRERTRLAGSCTNKDRTHTAAKSAAIKVPSFVASTFRPCTTFLAFLTALDVALIVLYTFSTMNPTMTSLAAIALFVVGAIAQTTFMINTPCVAIYPSA